MVIELSMVDSKPLEEIIQHLTKMALADGKITEEEQELLESVTVNVLVYDRALEDALEDGVITEEERETLAAMKDQLVTEAFEISKASDGIGDDEMKILRILLDNIDFEDDDE